MTAKEDMEMNSTERIVLHELDSKEQDLENGSLSKIEA